MARDVGSRSDIDAELQERHRKRSAQVVKGDLLELRSLGGVTERAGQVARSDRGSVGGLDD